MRGAACSAAGALALSVTTACIASAGAAPPQARDVLRWGLGEWRSLEPAAQEALLEGFTAGAAWRQAVGTEAEVGAAARRLRDSGRLIFHARPNVYVVRLADYWFWENHRAHRLARALWEVQASFSPRGGAGSRAPRPERSPDVDHAPRAQPRPGVTGAEFLVWPAGNRTAFAAGFVLGAATVQALEEGEPARLEPSLDRLREEGRLTLARDPAEYARAVERYFRAPGRGERGLLEAFTAVAAAGM